MTLALRESVDAIGLLGGDATGGANQSKSSVTGNEHKPPVACPDSQLIVPFCGASSIGHISAEETRE